jgi:hypothetical protein
MCCAAFCCDLQGNSVATVCTCPNPEYSPVPPSTHLAAGERDTARKRESANLRDRQHARIQAQNTHTWWMWGCVMGVGDGWIGWGWVTGGMDVGAVWRLARGNAHGGSGARTWVGSRTNHSHIRCECQNPPPCLVAMRPQRGLRDVAYRTSNGKWLTSLLLVARCSGIAGTFLGSKDVNMRHSGKRGSGGSGYGDGGVRSQKSRCSNTWPIVKRRCVAAGVRCPGCPVEN